MSALRAGKWVGIAVVALVVLFLLLLAFLDARADALRDPLSRFVSSRLGRPVHIEGRLELHLLSRQPHAVVNDITIGNPDWVGHGQLARVGRLTVQLELLPLLRGTIMLPLLEVEDADFTLLRDRSDRANWRLGSPNGESESKRPVRLPAVRSFSLQRARLEYEDQLRSLRLTGTVSADQRAAGGGPVWTRLTGNGEANGKPFALTAIGQPLLGVTPDKPYVLTAAVREGDTRLSGRVTIARPFDLGSLEADFSASGQDLADLYHLTRLALPNTAPYRLTARLYREGTKVRLRDLRGTVGSSDLHGEITVETANQRPAMTADISSTSLTLSDIAPAFGTRIPGAREKTAASAGRPPPPAPATKTDDRAKAHDKAAAAGELLFPHASLDPQRIRNMDASVRYRAESVHTAKLPLRQVAFQLKLDHGVMTIDPVSFVLAQGRVAGSVKMDATHDVPEVALDARITDVRLSQFHTKNGQAPLEGLMFGRALLRGRGTSVHAVVSTADGTVSAVVPHGEIRSAFAELTGINVANGLGLLLSKDNEKVDVRCGVAQFEAQKGTLVAKTLVFDTQNVLITGKGDIDLGNEQMDISLNGRPKQWRLLRVRSPIAIRGTLLKPAVGLNTGNAVGQGGVAVGLGALLGPLGAVLAFIDPGLAKDADCGALLAQHD